MKQAARLGCLPRLLFSKHLVDISQVQIVANLRNERWLDRSCLHGIPINTIKEDMALNVFDAFRSESFLGLYINKNINDNLIDTYVSLEQSTQ